MYTLEHTNALELPCSFFLFSIFKHLTKKTKRILVESANFVHLKAYTIEICKKQNQKEFECPTQ